MPIAQPPKNVPWFPEGDPLIRWEQVNPFHRLIDPYETYDLLVTFRNVERLNPVSYISKVIDNDDSEERFLQHPLVPFDLQFSNTQIYCYDRLIPQQRNTPVNYIAKMKEVIDKCWTMPLDLEETPPSGLFTSQGNVLEFEAVKNETAYLSFLVREETNFYNLQFIDFSLQEGKTYKVQLPDLCPCSIIVTASDNNKEIVEEAIRELSENILFDDIDAWINKLFEGDEENFDDGFNNAVVEKTTTIKTPIEFNQNPIEDMINANILRGFNEVVDTTVFLKENPNFDPNLEFSETVQSENYETPRRIKRNVQFANGRDTLIFEPETVTPNFFGFRFTNGFVFGDDTLSDCKEVRNREIERVVANTVVSRGEPGFAEAVAELEAMTEECTPIFDGFVWTFKDIVGCLGADTPNNAIFPVYTTPEGGASLLYERVDDINITVETTPFPDFAVEDVTLYNEIIRTNRPIWGNTVSDPYPQFYFYLSSNNDNPAYSDIYVSNTFFVYFRDLGINRFKLPLSVTEEIDTTPFPATVPMAGDVNTNNQYGEITENSCPIAQINVELATILEITGEVWSNNVDPDVTEPLNNDYVGEAVDRWNWEFEVDEATGEATGELTNR